MLIVFQLQKFAVHSDIPRAKMVHLADTSVNLATVVRSVCLELTACGAIHRSSIRLTNKDIFGVEALQSFCIQRVCFCSRIVLKSLFDVSVRSIGFLRRFGPMMAALPPTTSSMAVLRPLTVGLILRTCCTPRQITRVQDNVVQKSEIRDQHRNQQDVINGKNSGASASARSSIIMVSRMY
jgi:hypothetical protein